MIQQNHHSPQEEEKTKISGVMLLGRSQLLSAGDGGSIIIGNGTTLSRNELESNRIHISCSCTLNHLVYLFIISNSMANYHHHHHIIKIYLNFINISHHHIAEIYLNLVKKVIWVLS